MKKLILFLLLISGAAYGQQNNTTNTNFTNGLGASKFFNIPRGTTPPTTGVLAGSLFYHTTLGLQYYNGTTWQTVGLSGSGVTSFNTRTGAVTLLSADVTGALGFTPSNDANVVHKTGDEDIEGIKTFNDEVVINSDLTITGWQSTFDGQLQVVNTTGGSTFVVDATVSDRTKFELGAPSGGIIRGEVLSGSPVLTFINSSGVQTTISDASITAPVIIKSGGTVSQFLKADGSVDNTAYAPVSSLSSYVPYTGATGNVNLGTNKLGFGVAPTSTIHIKNAGGGLSGIVTELTNPASYATTDWLNDVGGIAQMLMTGSTFTNGVFQPNFAYFNSETAGGVGVAATSATGDVVFISGGNLAANVRQRIFANGNISIGYLSDQSKKLAVDGTGYFSGDITTLSFTKIGGTSSQFLKADGSVDANTYLTTTSAGTGYIQNQNTGAQATSNFWISGIGRANYLLADTRLETIDTYLANGGGVSLPTTGAAIFANSNKFGFGNVGKTYRSYFDYTNTADRTYTFPNITGNILTDNSTATLTNKSGNISQWTNDANYLVSADLSGYLPLTAGSGSPLSGILYHNVAGSITAYHTNPTTTGPSVQFQYNGSNDTYYGVEGSTPGSIFIGTSAYASVFGSASNRSVQLATNNTVQYTIDGSGNNTWTGSGNFGGSSLNINGNSPFIQFNDPLTSNVGYIQKVGTTLEFWVTPGNTYSFLNGALTGISATLNTTGTHLSLQYSGATKWTQSLNSSGDILHTGLTSGGTFYVFPNGVEAFSVNTTRVQANVPIVGTSATFSGDVSHASGTAVRLYRPSNTDFSYINNTGTGSEVNINFVTGVLAMTVAHNGNVGIGTTSPDRLSAGASAKVLTLMGSSGSQRGRLELGTTSSGTSDVLGGVTFVNNATYMGAIDAVLAGASNSSQLEFRTVNAGVTGLALTIASNQAITAAGDIYISKANPAAILQNAGATKGYFALATTASSYVTDADVNDLVIRTEGGAIRFTTNTGTSSALTIASNQAITAASSITATIFKPTTGYQFFFDSVNQGGIYPLKTWIGSGTDLTPTFATEVGYGFNIRVNGSASTGMTMTSAGVATFSADPIIPDEVYGAGWNGSLEPPTKNAIWDKIESLTVPIVGTYTPTLTSKTNIASSVAYPLMYVRTGDRVTVYGVAECTTTATGNSELYITLPVASTFNDWENVLGHGNTQTGGATSIVVNNENGGDKAILQFDASVTTQKIIYFSFMYKII